MVKYKVIGFDCNFKDSAYILDTPFAECLSVVKDVNKAKSFYSDEMQYIEKAIKKRKCKFEIIGEIEERPKEKVKAIKRKKD